MRLGATIPNFKADSTHGPIQFYDWLGHSWCVLLSTPVNFTSTCITDLSYIANYEREFRKRGVKLLVHTCDELQSYEAWIEFIKTVSLNNHGEVPFPIAFDESRELAVKLDILENSDREDTPETGRSLYVINPDKVLRLAMHFPVSTGGSVNEILRAIDSLQLTDRLKVVATPVNWTPGSSVMILPTVEEEDVAKLFPKGVLRIAMPSGKGYVRTTTDY